MAVAKTGKKTNKKGNRFIDDTRPSGVVSVKSSKSVKRWAFEKPEKFPCVTYRVPVGDLEQGLPPADTLLAQPVTEDEPKSPPKTPSSVGKTPYELKCAKALAEILNGSTEVTNDAGRVDVLTKNAVIELKIAHNWKHGIGQLLVYGYYYPGRSLELVLVGAGADEYLAAARFHCNRFSISVSVFGV